MSHGSSPSHQEQAALYLKQKAENEPIKTNFGSGKLLNVVIDSTNKSDGKIDKSSNSNNNSKQDMTATVKFDTTNGESKTINLQLKNIGFHDTTGPSIFSPKYQSHKNKLAFMIH